LGDQKKSIRLAVLFHNNKIKGMASLTSLLAQMSVALSLSLNSLRKYVTFSANMRDALQQFFTPRVFFVTCRNLSADLFSPVTKSLTLQCQSPIESYHELHGYACLPNILWKARLGPFIETHKEFRQLLRKTSTTRSAKNQPRLCANSDADIVI
jgi:hypothetical protein